MRLDTQCAELDAGLQSQQIAAFVAKGVAAVIVSPVDSARIGAALKGATDAHIPVFTMDGTAPSAEVEVTCHVSTNNSEGGRLAADELARLAGGKGEVLVLDDPGPSSCTDRLAGFREGLARRPGMRVSTMVAVGVDRARAQEITASQLRKHPGIKAIFALNDELALGANEACKAAKARGVVVVGYDGSPDAVVAIRAVQPLGADIAQAGQVLAATAVEMAVRSLAGESVKREVSLEPKPVDRDTLKKESEGPPVT
jgi:ABC-type sugar transport system substrate-binding protein